MRSKNEAPAALKARTGADNRTTGASAAYRNEEGRPTQVSIFEAEAQGAALRAAGHVAATANALEEAGHALDAGGLRDVARDLGKVAEIHRLAATRLAMLLRRLGEGTR